MSADLIARLRNWPARWINGISDEADDALEQQAREIERLNGLLQRQAVETLEANLQIKALRADAERYRFLKRHGLTVWFKSGPNSTTQAPCPDMDWSIDLAQKAVTP